MGRRRKDASTPELIHNLSIAPLAAIGTADALVSSAGVMKVCRQSKFRHCRPKNSQLCLLMLCQGLIHGVSPRHYDIMMLCGTVSSCYVKLVYRERGGVG